jgi:hypothetical protein
MERRQFLSAAATIAAVGALGVKADAQVATSNGEYGNSTLTTRASGLLIKQNGDQDFSLKIISMAADKDVTIERRVGPTAFQDIQLLYNLLQSLFLMRGLDV